MIVLNKHKDVIPKEAIYVGRGSSYGNPFKIGEHGTRDEVIDKYEIYIREAIKNKNPIIIEAFKELNQNSILCCFCDTVVLKKGNNYMN